MNPKIQYLFFQEACPKCNFWKIKKNRMLEFVKKNIDIQICQCPRKKGKKNVPEKDPEYLIQGNAQFANDQPNFPDEDGSDQEEYQEEPQDRMININNFDNDSGDEVQQESTHSRSYETRQRKTRYVTYDEFLQFKNETKSLIVKETKSLIKQSENSLKAYIGKILKKKP